MTKTHLSVGKDANVVAIHGRDKDRLHLGKHFQLRRSRRKYAVKFKGAFAAILTCDNDLIVHRELDRLGRRRSVPSLHSEDRPHSTDHSHASLELDELVVQLAPLCGLRSQPSRDSCFTLATRLLGRHHNGTRYGFLKLYRGMDSHAFLFRISILGELGNDILVRLLLR